MTDPHSRETAGDRDEPTDDQPRLGRRTMGERGVSEVLGAVLIFGLVILLIAMIQLNAVPAANQRVEFEHNQRVQGDMQGAQELISRTAATGIEGTIKIEAGTGYPTRLFLFNPPRSTGNLDLVDSGQLTMSHVTASGAAGDYLTGADRSFTTEALRYRPHYNEYRNAPATIYENGVLYNQYENAESVVQQRGSLVSGRRISLVMLQGQLSTASSNSVPLGVTPISGPARTVSVTDDGTPITLTIPTSLTAADWQSILSDELVANGGYVTAIRPGPRTGTISVEFKQGVTYDLRLAAIGIGTGFNQTATPQYLVDASGDGTVVPEGGTGQLTAEVRDRYNNPVNNVTVAAATATGTVSAVGSDRTDREGQVTFAYEAPGNVGGSTRVTVTAYFNGSAPRAQREATFNVTVLDTDGSGQLTTGGVNPSGGTSIALTDATLVNTGSSTTNCGDRGKDCVVDLTFKNLNKNTGKTVKQFRVGFYSAQGESAPNTFTVADVPDGTPSSVRDVGGSFENVTLDGFTAGGTSGDEQHYRLAFDFPGSGPSAKDGVIAGDFFVVELIYKDDSGTRTVATYFVAPLDSS
ncbi:MAG: hypothetical protein ABEI77_03745 [Halorientalis sp.]